MKLAKSLLLAASLLGLSLAGAATAQAQTAAEFYSGNTITLVVSAAAGGGSDSWARGFVPFLQKHIPGNPQILVNNLAGASGMAAAVQLQSNMNNDGTTIVMLQRNNLYLPLVSNVEVAFNPPEIPWLGSLNKESYGVLVDADSGIGSAEDLFKTPIKISATSFANENRVIPALLNEYYGTQFEIIQGYDGSPAMSLALERGEVDGRLVSLDFLLTFAPEKPWLDDGRAAVVLTTALERSDLFPDVPSILELTDDLEVRQLTEFMMLPMEAGLPFAVPPGIAEDRLATLRKAFIDAAKDPEYIKFAEEQGSIPKPITGEAVQEIVDRLYATPESTLDKVRALINPPN